MTTKQSASTEGTKKTSQPMGEGPDDGLNPEQRAQERVRECNASLTILLQKYNCRIVPFFDLEQVGNGPLMKAIVSTNYGLIPNP